MDVGNVIQLYAEFSRSGATYTPYPDPRSYTLRLADLADPALRERLRQVWLDPQSLDPAQVSARVTRDIATRLADVAKSLEADGHAAETVAGFLSRCLFSMFAEDVGLLPKRTFSDLLESLVAPLAPVGAGLPAIDPALSRASPLLQTPVPQFVPLVGELWRAMDTGAFSVALRAQFPRFNGKLFKDVTDAHGAVQSRWDGRSVKKHPVTGEDVPDEAAQVPLERYRNPRRLARGGFRGGESALHRRRPHARRPGRRLRRSPARGVAGRA